METVETKHPPVPAHNFEKGSVNTALHKYSQRLIQCHKLRGQQTTLLLKARTVEGLAGQPCPILMNLLRFFTGPQCPRFHTNQNPSASELWLQRRKEGIYQVDRAKDSSPAMSTQAKSYSTEHHGKRRQHLRLLHLWSYNSDFFFSGIFTSGFKQHINLSSPSEE